MCVSASVMVCAQRPEYVCEHICHGVCVEVRAQPMRLGLLLKLRLSVLETMNFTQWAVLLALGDHFYIAPIL